MSRLPYHRMTPWVGRLIVANAVVLLLLMTLTPALTGSLAFNPQQPVVATSNRYAFRWELSLIRQFGI